MTIPVIAIDGPSGVGKGTISQRVAQDLGWHYLDSGALYRVLAWAAMSQKVELTNSQALVELVQTIDIVFAPNNQVLLNNEDISTAIRTEDCGGAASKIAVLAPVRAALLELQHAFCKPPGLVADGRDMASVVFPNAQLKLFLTASAEARAKRRYKQLKEKENNVTLSAILNDVETRDRRDSQRAVAPLQATSDAVVIDTTHLNIEQVLAEVQILLSKANITLG